MQCTLHNKLICKRLCKPVEWPEDWSSRETLNKSIYVSRFCQKPRQFHADALWNVSVVNQISLLLWKTKITGNSWQGYDRVLIWVDSQSWIEQKQRKIQPTMFIAKNSEVVAKKQCLICYFNSYHFKETFNNNNSRYYFKSLLITRRLTPLVNLHVIWKTLYLLI